MNRYNSLHYGFRIVDIQMDYFVTIAVNKMFAFL